MFLSIIFFTIIAFWLLGKISKWVLQAYIVRKQREMREQFGAEGGYKTFGGGSFQGFYGFGGNGPRQARKDEGEVVVEQTQTEGHTVSKKVGEYVEFEEVEISEVREN